MGTGLVDKARDAAGVAGLARRHALLRLRRSLLDRYRRASTPAEQREVSDTLKRQGVVLRPGVDSDDDLIH